MSVSARDEEGPKKFTISVNSFTWLLIPSNSLILRDLLSDFSASCEKEIRKKFMYATELTGLGDVN